MQATINGKPETLEDGTTVAMLLERLLLSKQPAAVEVNKELVPKRRHAERMIVDGDRVEIVTLVGGG